MSAAILSKEDLMQEQILKAAKHLFQVHGLAKVTMDDVAKAIGKGRSSLYYYYKNKDEIFDAVVMIEIHDMLSAMAKAVDEAAGIEQKLHAFFLTKLEVYREKKAFFKVLDAGMDADALSDFKKTKVKHHQLIIRMESKLLDRFLTEAMARGEMRTMAPSDLDTLIWVLLSSLRGLKNELDFETGEVDALPVVNMFIQMAMVGIRK
jgi:AcrR family transcriptional regulator